MPTKMMCNYPPEEELGLIKKTVSVFEEVLGEPLRGWRTCFASHHTIDLLLEHFSFEWDASLWNDDLPYVIEGHGNKLLEIPFSQYGDASLAIQITNPAPVNPFCTWHTNTPSFIAHALRAQFNALYERGADQPGADAAVGTRLHFRPSLAGEGVDVFIAFAKQHDGVVFTTHDEVRSWCMKNYLMRDAPLSGETDMRLLKPIVALLCLGAALVLPSLLARAETFPSRGIKIISPHPPGVATDVLGRALAQRLAESFGVPVIVENRPGANGIIAAGTVAKADPDGYTILITSGSHILVAHGPNLPFDVLKDFTPVTQLAASYGLALITNLPVKNVQELVALAKSKPGQLTYATNGVGNITHVAGLLFDARNGTKNDSGSVRNTPNLTNDVVAGTVDMTFFGGRRGTAREGREDQSPRPHRTAPRSRSAGHADAAGARLS